MDRENQQLIAIRLDPSLLAAVDRKRKKTRQSRSELIREAIFEMVRSEGVSKDLIYPQDRVGASKGGRPRKSPAAETSMLNDETNSDPPARLKSLNYQPAKKAKKA